MSTVSKRLRSLALAALFHSLSVRMDLLSPDRGLVKLIAARPELVSHIRYLRLDDGRPKPEQPVKAKTYPGLKFLLKTIQDRSSRPMPLLDIAVPSDAIKHVLRGLRAAPALFGQITAIRIKSPRNKHRARASMKRGIIVQPREIQTGTPWADLQDLLHLTGSAQQGLPNKNLRAFHLNDREGNIVTLTDISVHPISVEMVSLFPDCIEDLCIKTWDDAIIYGCLLPLLEARWTRIRRVRVPQVNFDSWRGPHRLNKAAESFLRAHPKLECIDVSSHLRRRPITTGSSYHGLSACKTAPLPRGASDVLSSGREIIEHGYEEDCEVSRRDLAALPSLCRTLRVFHGEVSDAQHFLRAGAQISHLCLERGGTFVEAGSLHSILSAKAGAAAARLTCLDVRFSDDPLGVQAVKLGKAMRIIPMPNLVELTMYGPRLLPSTFGIHNIDFTRTEADFLADLKAQHRIAGARGKRTISAREAESEEESDAETEESDWSDEGYDSDEAARLHSLNDVEVEESIHARPDPDPVQGPEGKRNHQTLVEVLTKLDRTSFPKLRALHIVNRNDYGTLPTYGRDLKAAFVDASAFPPALEYITYQTAFAKTRAVVQVVRPVPGPKEQQGRQAAAEGEQASSSPPLKPFLRTRSPRAQESVDRSTGVWRFPAQQGDKHESLFDHAGPEPVLRWA